MFRISRSPVRATAAMITAAALASASLTSMTLWSSSAPASAAAAPVRGIDVASWQHPGGAPINWSKVRAAGYTFAIIKATESTTYTNPYYAGDHAGARAAGLVVGSYHFARPALPLSTANEQARYFAKTIGNLRLGKTLPPVLDIESTGGLSPVNLSAWMKRFLVELQQRTGRAPMIYSYDSFLRTRVANAAQFRAYPLWYANYTSQTPTAVPMPDWPAWRIWQYSSSGTVPGISGRTDLNRFAGTYAQLMKFATGRVPAGVYQSVTQRYEPARISGRLDPAYAGETVRRQVRSKGKWVTVSSKKVWSNGYYWFGIKPGKLGEKRYRVALVSNSPYARAYSSELRVVVIKPWVNASQSAKTVKRGTKATLYGLTDSFYVGERVVRQKRTKRGWVSVATTRVGKDGRFRFTVKPTTRTTYQYRFSLRSYSPRVTKLSRTLTLRVK